MKISVCIATYNGEQFLEEQLRSILNQLKPHDEIIISDDHSTDGTINVIRTIGDARVILLINETNIGHVRNFERAISCASGDVVFLSDQDDIWHPEKASVILREFTKHPNVMMIHHTLTTMNERGITIKPLFNPHPEGEAYGARHLLNQLLKCTVFGCGIAFRRELLQVLLPFPSCVYAHDHWLTAASGWKGGMLQINAPLVRYRQHSHNVTPKNGLSWRRRVVTRWLMLRMIVTAAIRTYRYR